MDARIIALATDDAHRFSKPTRASVRLIAGIGIEGDVHAGVMVKHRARVKQDPDALNLRQVHLIHAELLDEMREQGFSVGPGDLGENVTTQGIDLLGLSSGTRLRLGAEAVVEVTGLRNPCRLINENIAKGAMAATLDRAPDGSLVRKAGVMAIVVSGGEVRAGDPISIESRPETFVAMEPV
ncbi:MOSC domain-containing protein [Altericroceibacterium xinjiangense]|uniref:MOSC domain-containing protein n=1 Tax=Altericroceibacterium xinjiangense TaxID=762261 RepID=UPI000F7DAF8D|nr:MOSC domain-containing protein [Altericroceibacterium xinjiangense]